MYTIIYNDLFLKQSEAIACFSTFKKALTNLSNVASSYADDTKMTRPITLWNTQEFNLAKIRNDVNLEGHWMVEEKNRICVYAKTIVKSWFTSVDIKEVGYFQIVENPPEQILSESYTEPILSNCPNTNISVNPSLSMIDQLKEVLKKPNKSLKKIPQKVRTLENSQMLKFVQNLRARKSTLSKVL